MEKQGKPGKCKQRESAHIPRSAVLRPPWEYQQIRISTSSHMCQDMPLQNPRRGGTEKPPGLLGCCAPKLAHQRIRSTGWYQMWLVPALLPWAPGGASQDSNIVTMSTMQSTDSMGTCGVRCWTGQYAAATIAGSGYERASLAIQCAARHQSTEGSSAMRRPGPGRSSLWRLERPVLACRCKTQTRRTGTASTVLRGRSQEGKNKAWKQPISAKAITWRGRTISLPGHQRARSGPRTHCTLREFRVVAHRRCSTELILLWGGAVWALRVWTHVQAPALVRRTHLGARQPLGTAPKEVSFWQCRSGAELTDRSPKHSGNS